MQVNARMLIAMVAGVFCTLGALTLAGGHPQYLLHMTSFLVVIGTAFGGLLMLRGASMCGQLLRAVFVKHDGDAQNREQLMDAVEVFERTSMLGGFVGLMAGSMGAIHSFYEPTSVGPSIALAIISLVYSASLNLFVAMPLKHQLLREVEPSMQLPRGQIVVRFAKVSVVVLLAMIALVMLPETSVGLTMVVSITTGLVMLGAVIPSALVAGDSVFTSPVSERRQLWYSNSLVCGGVVALSCELMHLFSVLDQPSMLPAGIAWAFASLVLPVTGAVLLRLRTPHESLRVAPAGRLTSANTYFGFAAFAVASLLGLVLLVIFCLQSMDAVAATAPR